MRYIVKLSSTRNRGVRVMRSNAGYYIGQGDEDGFPYSRLSVAYYDNRDAATRAMKTGFFGGRTENLAEEKRLLAAGVLELL